MVFMFGQAPAWNVFLSIQVLVFLSFAGQDALQLKADYKSFFRFGYDFDYQKGHHNIPNRLKI